MTETPDYETFMKGTRANGWAIRFVQTLVPGEPQRVPVENSKAATDNPISTYGGAVRKAAHRMELKIAVRIMFDGELWACRLRNEDVNGK